MMLIAVLAAVCVALLLLGFLAPRFSRKPEHGLDRGIEKAGAKAEQQGGLTAKLGRNSSNLSEKAVDRSTETGRNARRKLS